MKKPYQAPRITVLGDIRDVTQTGLSGDFTDAAFAADTPRGKLTFHS